MAILALRKTGGGADFDRLTAVPEDVAAGKKFLGAGSDETQEGTMPVQGSPSIILPANGSVTLSAGKYTGGQVSQQIETMGEQSIGPGAKQITINCAGKYMTGNIIVRATKNLTVSNIKKTQYVGGVGPGVWEGYVNTDPFTPYLYGTFNGEQSITSFRGATRYQSKGSVSMAKDHIAMSNGSMETCAYVFNAPVNVTNINSLMLEMSGVKALRVIIARKRTTDYVYAGNLSEGYTLNTALGDVLLEDTIGGTGNWSTQKTFNVSGITGNVYLYICSRTSESSANLYVARFNS